MVFLNIFLLQENIYELWEWKNDIFFHIIDQIIVSRVPLWIRYMFQGYRCESGIVIFERRVTWNPTYSPFKCPNGWSDLPSFCGTWLAPGKAFNSAVIKTILIRNLDFQHFKNPLINTEKSLKDLIFFKNAHRLNITKSKNHYCKHSLKLEKKHNSVAEFG